jgi:hypothetical protein
VKQLPTESQSSTAQRPKYQTNSVLVGTAIVCGLISAVACFAAYRTTTREPIATKREGIYFVNASYDFGPVRLNEKLRGTFVIENSSAETVMVGQIAKSCACTAIEPTKRVLAPGERSEIAFELQVGQRRGDRAETLLVNIDSQDGKNLGVLPAKILYTGKGLVNVTPAEIVLTHNEPTAIVTTEIDDEAKNCKILEATVGHECIKLDKADLSKITLTLDPAAVHESWINTTFTIQTNVPGEDQVAITVRIRK